MSSTPQERNISSKPPAAQKSSTGTEQFMVKKKSHGSGHFIGSLPNRA